jgi:hypothetical protein
MLSKGDTMAIARANNKTADEWAKDLDEALTDRDACNNMRFEALAEIEQLREIIALLRQQNALLKG